VFMGVELITNSIDMFEKALVCLIISRHKFSKALV